MAYSSGLLKPDCPRRGLEAQVLAAIEKAGLKVIVSKRVRLTEAQIAVVYEGCLGEIFYPELLDFFLSGDCLAFIVEGEDAIARLNRLVGYHEPSLAEPNSIRGRFGLSVKENAIHGTEDETAFRKEVELFFTEKELSELLLKILGIASNMIISSAALLIDGKIVAAAPEERFVGKKYTRAFPINAIEFCLAEAGIKIEDVDYTALSADPGIDLSIYDSRYASVTRWYPEALCSIPNNLSLLYKKDYLGPTEQVFTMPNGQTKIKYIKHHLCHAANGFFLSPFKSAAILTVDGRGERITASFGLGNSTRIEEIKSIDYPHSLGLFYGAITEYLGYRPDKDEGKVMGMAGFGKDVDRYYRILRKLVKLGKDGSFELDLNYFRYYMSPRRHLYADSLVSLLEGPRKAFSDFEQRHFDIAAALQKVTEETLVHMLNYLHQETKEDFVVVNGGVFMNSVFNGKLLELTPFKKFFVSSCPDDCGTSIGAALYVHHMEEDGQRTGPQKENYYGPSFSDEEIEKKLRRAKLPVIKEDDIVKKTADLLAKGKIIGWFQGKMELGQRALGNRSILADPRRPDMKDAVNNHVKYREWFRPFAPSVLAEDFELFFPGHDPENSRYMSLVLAVGKSQRKALSATLHADETARPQSVYKEASPLFYKLITEFKKITGVGAVLNTSFNVGGEPIVCTPEDAIRTFFKSGIDVLAMGNYILDKESFGK